MHTRSFTGRVRTGAGQGAGFTSLGWVRDAFRRQFGIDPYPGTLNVQPDTPDDQAAFQALRAGPPVIVRGEEGACNARCFPVRLADRYPAAVVLPEVDGYPDDRVELVAALPLREHLRLRDGNRVTISCSAGPAVTAAIFDVDGTLVNSVDAYHIAAGRAAAPFGFEVTREAVRTALNGQYKFWELIVPDYESRGEGFVENLSRETMRHWKDVLDEHVSVIPGVEDTLEQLRAAGVRLAIYTGSRGESFAPLETSGLLDYFEFVLTGAEVEQAKPHPEGVLRCLEVLGVEATNAAYVGDSVPDMGAGLAAGTRAVGLLTGASDSAGLTEAGAHRLAASHDTLVDILLARW
jgi:HAD superfamily hydrolase (TIGR01509 family)